MEILNQIALDIGENIISKRSSGVVESKSGRKIFIKSGASSTTYRCEANGLKELTKSREVNTANVLSVGNNYIATEYIKLSNPHNGFFEKFGRQLAKMHRTTARSFGFYEDNFIGDNPQKNLPTEKEALSWSEFYYNKRLLYQYRLAENNGYIDKLTAINFAKLEQQIAELFKGTEESPTLLHGDLWRGNFICNEKGEAILIDPAVYYGHREADLAMTIMFGGFSSEFYNSYNLEYPLAEGWNKRINIYKLYHVMNHLNLFGRGYLNETEAIIAQYAK